MPQNGHHPRVLVVDDDHELAEVLRQALRESGYAVATVRHGAAALELTSGKAGGRIVLLTGHPNVREITATIGADAYLDKPFELTELLRTLEQQLRAIG